MMEGSAVTARIIENVHINADMLKWSPHRLLQISYFGAEVEKGVAFQLWTIQKLREARETKRLQEGSSKKRT